MIEIRHCGIAELEVEPESVDLILTDPPYPREFLPLWAELGAFAARVLRPGGSLVAMSGQVYLNEVVAALDVEGLTYRWTFACMTPGSNARIWPIKIYVGWKPILWYAKGPAVPRRWMEDRIVGRAPDKKFHKWGQDVSIFDRLVRLFSERGSLVVDPFLGGGTSAIVAAMYRRSFLGCDVDEKAIRSTAARLEGTRDALRLTDEIRVPDFAVASLA